MFVAHVIRGRPKGSSVAFGDTMDVIGDRVRVRLSVGLFYFQTVDTQSVMCSD